MISDTHGLLRPQALKILRNSDVIIHPGDIGDPDILKKLQTIAPVHAVRGNNDRDTWAEALPISLDLRICGRRIYVIHNLREMEIDPESDKYSIVISGHSHHPGIERRNGILFMNPGSAGPRRFHLPVAVGKIWLSQKSIRSKIFKFSA